MAKAKILVFDIESGPNLGYVWGKYDQNVIKFEQEWALLSFAYKWLGERKTIAVGTDKFTEEQLVVRMWTLLNEADVVIAHNGDKFDIKMLNSKFMEYNLSPPSHYRSIDTLKEARKNFRFTSNKLDDLGQKFGVGKKAETGGYDTWFACMKGDKKAWAKMLKYNKQDVVLLEKVYLKLLPWIKNHPNIGLIEGRPNACPNCGHEKMQSRGEKFTKTASVRSFQCTSCGGWAYHRKALKSDVKYVN